MRKGTGWIREALRGLLGCLAFLLVATAAHADSDEGHNFSTAQEVYAAHDSVPLWLHANKFGRVPDDSWSSITSASYRYLGGKGRDFRFDAGLALSGIFSKEGVEPYLGRADASVAWRFVEFRGGVFPFTRGFVAFPELSSGSMSISGNAEPIPLVQLATPDFVALPFTGDRVGVLGGISQGWIPGDRFVENPLLHEKWAYLQLGKKEEGLVAYGGLVHQVTWAGSSDFLSDQNQPAGVSLANFWRAFFSSGGGSDSPTTDQKNALGNTVGIWDLGLTMNLSSETAIRGYYHHFFEGRGSFEWNNGLDGLFGLGLELPELFPGFPTKLLFERVKTTYQSGPLHAVVDDDGDTLILGGRDSYYHNGIYQNGWSHKNRILGTPLFVLIGEDEDARVASNRIEARHLAIAGNVSSSMDYRLLLTRVRHRPAYASESIVTEEENGLVQWHGLLELGHTLRIGNKDELRVAAAIGSDYGQVYEDSFGLGFSVSWRR